jgi:hypothetical protein
MEHQELECTRYVEDDDEWPYMPPKCPVCGGFLKWNNGNPICNKCGTDLLVIPDKDEETGEETEYSGKICPISKPKKPWRENLSKSIKKSRQHDVMKQYGYPLPRGGTL